MSGELPQGASVELSIETGPHAGVKRRLAFGRLSIGHGLDSDIVLADETIASPHAELELSAKGVAVRALDGDLALLGDRGVLRPGEQEDLAWPAHVTLGRTRLRFDLQGQPHPRTVISRSTIWPALSGAAVLVAAVLLGSQYLPAFGGPDTGLDSPALPEALNLTAADNARSDGGAAASGLVASPSDRNTLDSAVDGLEQQMDAVGLNGLEVRGEDGAVVVSGLLDSDDEARWRDVEMWFDQRFGSTIPLDSRLSVDDRQGPPDIAIRAVWSGTPSYMVAGDGQRYSVGSIVPGGWKIDAIETNAILFRRDRQTFRFEFQS